MAGALIRPLRALLSSGVVEILRFCVTGTRGGLRSTQNQNPA